jgi:hypothetical protein
MKGNEGAPLRVLGVTGSPGERGVRKVVMELVMNWWVTDSAGDTIVNDNPYLDKAFVTYYIGKGVTEPGELKKARAGWVTRREVWNKSADREWPSVLRGVLPKTKKVIMVNGRPWYPQ